MPSSDDDPFANPDPAEMEDLERWREGLMARITEYYEEEEIPDELISVLLAEIGLTLRSTAYVVATKKPSASGLKLELDRFRREIDGLIRAMKKSADEFIATARKAKTEQGWEPE